MDNTIHSTGLSLGGLGGDDDAELMSCTSPTGNSPIKDVAEYSLKTALVVDTLMSKTAYSHHGGCMTFEHVDGHVIKLDHIRHKHNFGILSRSLHIGHNT